jgi:hypothetical protein
MNGVIEGLGVVVIGGAHIVDGLNRPCTGCLRLFATRARHEGTRASFGVRDVPEGVLVVTGTATATTLLLQHRNPQRHTETHIDTHGTRQTA